VAQRGFGPGFLDPLSSVSVDSSEVCARAAKQRKRVIVEDVQTDPQFASHQAVAAAAGYRGVQSTPIMSRTGELLGVLSTHFRDPQRPSERALRMIDLYARQAAEVLEHMGVEPLRRQRLFRAPR
jgi:GAF domain-containing protein